MATWQRRLFIQFSLSSSTRRLQERPLLQIFERLLEFLLRVHHDRTVPSNGLLQRLPRDQEEPDSFLACLYLYLITSVEENKRAIVSLRRRRRVQPADSFRRNSERAGCVAKLSPARDKRGKHDFAFSGLIACHACGCAVVGEVKKERYVYYHCTGYADKCQGNPASCRRRYVREELLEKQFTELLGRLKFDDEVLEGVREALHASHGDERREHEEAIRRLQGEHRRLGDRINAMYDDRLDGRVDGAFFDKMSAEWREEQNRSLREIERHEAAEQSYMDEGVQILELARNAQRLFEAQEPRQKRRLLNVVLSNCTWEDGQVVATFRQPFDLLAETTAIAARHWAGNTAKSAKSEIWLTTQAAANRSPARNSLLSGK